MKTFLLTVLGVCLATALPAQGPADDPPATRLTPSELDELLGPIALYPDALIALILPASTVPSDIVLGARFVASGGDPARADDKPWDSSVRALTRYPDTLKWLDENLEWTTQVGDAFIAQPVDVMEAIQQLRAKARELGNLVDTPQQRIVMDEAKIRIIPAQPEYIFEPRYDPEVIYYDRPVAGPLLFFSAGYGVGSWLNYDCDWHHHRLYRGEWHGGWDYSRDRVRRDREDYYYINNHLTNSREWRPDPARHHAQSHIVSGRASTTSNAPVRALSRDPEANDPRKFHAGIVHPKPIADASRHAETIRRAEPGDRGKVGDDRHERGARDRVEHKRTADDPPIVIRRAETPSSQADHKKTADDPPTLIRRAEIPPGGANRKKAADDPPIVIRRAETPSNHAEHKKPVDDPSVIHSKKNSDARARSEVPKHESVKVDEPRHKEVPKHEEAQQHHDPPKHPEAAKHEEGKSRAESANDKGKKGDKKKDKDDDKKKKE